MLRSATEHERAQQEIQRSALRQARSLRTAPAERLWRALTSWQMLAAVAASRWLPVMLEEQRIEAEAVAPMILAAQVGTASDGRSLRSLLEFAQRESTAREFDVIVATQLQDAARSTLATDIATRPALDGYTRQIQAGACSRCAILAGRFYRWNEGFDRHPDCNCEHIPTREDVAGDVTTDPRAYFESLDEAEQDRVFTKAGAEAIRMGADPVQVVNARRGMSTAQPKVVATETREVFRFEMPGSKPFVVHNEFTTTEAGRRRLARDEHGLFTTEEGTLTRQGRSHLALGRDRARLMPESILEMSGGDRDRALDLLVRHGYVR